MAESGKETTSMRRRQSPSYAGRGEALREPFRQSASNALVGLDRQTRQARECAPKRFGRADALIVKG